MIIDMPRKISRCFFTFLIVLSLTATLSSAEPGQKIVRRVQFERGRTTAVLKGTIRHGQEIVYVLRASKGQTLTAHITATTPNNDVVFSIEGPGGRELTDGIDTDWSGTLPATGDYRISVGMIESKASQYTLEVTIRNRGD